jgi:hypothetical protein
MRIRGWLGAWREIESRAGLWSGRVILEIKAAVFGKFAQ